MKPTYLVIPHGTKEQIIPESTTHGTPCLIYGNKENASNGVIIYLHGGPAVQLTNLEKRNPNSPNPDSFFNYLVEEGFLVMVPDIRGSSISDEYYANAASEFDSRLYVKDIKDVVDYCTTNFHITNEQIFGIFHSLGVHQGMHAMLQDSQLFSRVVLFAGTLYFGARIFHEFGASELNAEQLTMDSPIELLKEFLNKRLKGSLNLTEFLDRRQGKEINDMNTIIHSAMTDPRLNQEMSIGANTQNIPSKKIFISHAIPDTQVPVEFAINFWQALSGRDNVEAHIYSTGDHYHFYAQIDLLHSMITFLKNQDNTSSKLYLDKKEISAEQLKKQIPQDSVTAHEKFLNSEPHRFQNTDIPGLKEYLESYLHNLDVIEKRFSEIERSVVGSRWMTFFSRIQSSHVVEKLRAQAQELQSFITEHSLSPL
jgi:pimeloyl-ACP methyl ester carboxylesterase